MRKSLRILGVGGVLLVAALAIGCTSGPTGARRTNLLGVVTSQSGNYDPAPPTTIAVSASELGAPKQPTGKQVRLLWGLITLNNY